MVRLGILSQIPGSYPWPELFSFWILLHRSGLAPFGSGFRSQEKCFPGTAEFSFETLCSLCPCHKTESGSSRLLMNTLSTHNSHGKLKIVVIGGGGLIGSKLVGNLREREHEVIAASP